MDRPAEAVSLNPDAVMQVLGRVGVDAVIADPCVYGVLTWSKNGKAMAARKRTKFMANCPEISAKEGDVERVCYRSRLWPRSSTQCGRWSFFRHRFSKVSECSSATQPQQALRMKVNKSH